MHVRDSFRIGAPGGSDLEIFHCDLRCLRVFLDGVQVLPTDEAAQRDLEGRSTQARATRRADAVLERLVAGVAEPVVVPIARSRRD